jgi:hypothetical protein
MSSEQITQNDVPVEETTQTTTDTPQVTEQPVTSTTTEQPTVAKSWKEQSQKSLETIQTFLSLQK